MSTLPNEVSRSATPDLEQAIRPGKLKTRMLTDSLTRHLVTLGGIGTIIAITVIFAYLLWVVFPLFRPASIEAAANFALRDTTVTQHMAIEESHSQIMRVLSTGEVVFDSLNDGQPIDRITLPFAAQRVVPVENGTRTLLVVGPAGEALFVRPRYSVSFDESGDRFVIPELAFPYGETPLQLPTSGPELNLAVAATEDSIRLASLSGQTLFVQSWYLQTSLFDDVATLEAEGDLQIPLVSAPDFLLITPNGDRLFAANKKGQLWHYDLNTPSAPAVQQQLLDDAELTALTFLTGGSSLLAGDNKGRIAQWMQVRTDTGYTLAEARHFDAGGPVAKIVPEAARKGFIAVTDQGRGTLFHSTAERRLLSYELGERAPQSLTLAPRADMLAALDNNRLTAWSLDNPHPEVSVLSLIRKVWYEGYDEEQFLWQSTAATGDAEPKYSLTPLLFGTIKAAFYALLFAIPLAILGAIHTAYFMRPATRKIVKPSIEIMEAIPTVILGFLAGLWLAPLIETHLPAIFLLILFLPFAVLTTSFVWHVINERVGGRFNDVWQIPLLMLIIFIAVWLAFAISPWLESTFFGGDMRIYLAEQWGLDFDQRNALIVGIAMGFAVIPTIFSIAEDALFSVPKHLTQGALALGATPWQSLVRVVLPTASPAIFSAVMMGLGRAVGETMIILMATGNTPIMDMNIFEGMRTLSANIAVEMPESSVGSTHYRVLFLTALLLFVVTFFFNSLAETVRHRLRKKFSRY